MNILPLVLSLLFILAYGSHISLGKYADSHRLRTSFLGHSRANRQILSSYESALYDNFDSKKGSEEAKPKEQKPKTTLSPQPENHEIYAPKVNPECARLNIAPLLDPTALEANRFLYELTAHLLKTFYNKLLSPKTERPFLDALLKALREQHLPLEKLDLKNPSLQSLYYRMLKGKKSSYPSLLDYVKLNLNDPAPIRLYRADTLLIQALFGPRAGEKIFYEMHKKNALPITQDDILRLCQEAHTPLFDLQLFPLLKFGKTNDDKDSRKQTLVETEGAVTLRKDLYVSLK